MEDKERINNQWNSVLIPMIRKIMPTVITQDIVGVQPMGSKRLVYEVVTDTEITSACPQNHHIVMVNVEVGLWIEQQPIHMWKPFDMNYEQQSWQIKNHYVVSEQLLTWLRLKWSDV